VRRYEKEKAQPLDRLRTTKISASYPSHCAKSKELTAKICARAGTRGRVHRPNQVHRIVKRRFSANQATFSRSAQAPLNQAAMQRSSSSASRAFPQGRRTRGSGTIDSLTFTSAASPNRSSALETLNQGGVMEEAGVIATRDIGEHLPVGSETTHVEQHGVGLPRDVGAEDP
jgi:hypothetical protein